MKTISKPILVFTVAIIVVLVATLSLCERDRELPPDLVASFVLNPCGKPDLPGYEGMDYEAAFRELLGLELDGVPGATELLDDVSSACIYQFHTECHEFIESMAERAREPIREELARIQEQLADPSSLSEHELLVLRDRESRVRGRIQVREYSWPSDGWRVAATQDEIDELCGSWSPFSETFGNPCAACQ